MIEVPDASKFPPLTKKEILILDLQDAQGYVKRGWTKGVSARDDKGEDVSPSAPQAVSWCILGACDAACPTNNQATALSRMIREAHNIASVAWMNDVLENKEQAVAVFDKTIEYVRIHLDDNLNRIPVSQT